MPYYEGGSTEGRRFKNADIKKILKGVLVALRHMHEAGLAHRDIKPDNIFLGPAGDAYLGDLGLAALIGQGGYAESQVGTLPYMAPEVTYTRLQ